MSVVIDGTTGITVPSGASQAQAEAGTDNTVLMTPLRTAQAIDALSVFTSEYVSANQTITSGGLLTLAHGLGAQPKIVFLELICTTADGGFAVDDVLMIGVNSATAGDNRHTSVYMDATNVYVRYSSTANVFTSGNKNTGTASLLVNGSWRLRVRAFA